MLSIPGQSGLHKETCLQKGGRGREEPQTLPSQALTQNTHLLPSSEAVPTNPTATNLSLTCSEYPVSETRQRLSHCALNRNYLSYPTHKPALRRLKIDLGILRSADLKWSTYGRQETRKGILEAYLKVRKVSRE